MWLRVFDVSYERKLHFVSKNVCAIQIDIDDDLVVMFACEAGKRIKPGALEVMSKHNCKLNICHEWGAHGVAPQFDRFGRST